MSVWSDNRHCTALSHNFTFIVRITFIVGITLQLTHATSRLHCWGLAAIYTTAESKPVWCCRVVLLWDAWLTG